MSFDSPDFGHQTPHSEPPVFRLLPDGDVFSEKPIDGSTDDEKQNSECAASNCHQELHPYQHQIGGKHHRIKAGNKGSKWAKMFLHHGGSAFSRRTAAPPLVYKPITPGIRGQVEFDFYRLAFPHVHSAYRPTVERPIGSAASFCPQLLWFIPAFRGTAIISSDDGSPADYLRLVDLTWPLEGASMADIKMGTQTFDDEAPASKKETELAKFPHQARLGFRFTGMKVLTSWYSLTTNSSCTRASSTSQVSL
jgi:hypothetical protein